MTTSRLIALTPYVKRIEYCGMHVDIIKTTEGLVRLGSMPDIAKFMAEHDLAAGTVIVPPWEATMAGDNHTGEEFILWEAQVKGGDTKKYVGAPADLDLFYRNLDTTFAFYFDEKRLSIEEKTWISNWVSKHPADPVYESGSLKIWIKNEEIIVIDQEQTLYTRHSCAPGKNPDRLVEETLEKIPRDKRYREKLEIQAIGTGNGFTEITSNCLVRFGDKTIWIDPCGYPAHALARYGIHWDDVTHLVITHNHEDHTQGFSACLKRAEKTGIPLRLMTAPGIHEILEQHFAPIFPDFSSLVDLIPLKPGIPVKIDDIEVNCRLNHHFLPFGTLGLKFSAAGNTFGYSGDTKFDVNLNAALGRAELTPEWFAECDLVFHEVDFKNPNGVHTFWRQLQLLTQKIPGQVLAYHTQRLDNAPLPLVEQGKIYRLG